MTTPDNPIRERRDVLGYSQEQLAALVGVSVKTISKWENFSRVPQISRRRAIAEALRVDVAAVKAMVDVIAKEKTDAEVAGGSHEHAEAGAAGADAVGDAAAAHEAATGRATTPGTPRQTRAKGDPQ